MPELAHRHFEDSSCGTKPLRVKRLVQAVLTDRSKIFSQGTDRRYSDNMGPKVEIAIGGRRAEGTLEHVQLRQLRLDPTNVRFKHLEMELPEAEIEHYIWEEEDAKTLYKQIKTSGGLTEAPVILRTSDEQFLVKEGNRRIVCLRRLSNEAAGGKLAEEGYKYPKDHFDIVQCIVLPPDLSQKDLDSLIGMRHVSGPKEWATLNRAWHIYEMYNRDNMDYDEIRTVLGFGKGTVIRMVNAFEKTMEYGKKHPEDRAWFRKFTYFDEFYKKSDLRGWADQDPGNLGTFIDWVAQKKFNDVRDVRVLPDIIADPDAMKIFVSVDGDIVKARETLSRKNPAISSQTFATVKKTIEALRSIPRNEFIQTSHDSSRVKLLKDLRSEVDSLLEDLDKIRPDFAGT